LRHKVYQTIIIGAGPAGLAVANSLYNQGCDDFLLLERGKSLPQRTRYSAPDIASGIGGAGLFSDGKFSFYPSATGLWKNLHLDVLQESYRWLQQDLKKKHLTVPDFDDRTWLPSANPYFKLYPSYYLNFSDRYDLINEWSNLFLANTQVNALVTGISAQNKGYCVQTDTGAYLANNIVIATGRMGPLQMSTYTLPLIQTFQRIEIGVRLEGHHMHPFFQELQNYSPYPDPKFIFTDSEDERVSWRTFCFCKRGEVVSSGDEEYIALSGRGDCAPTDLSNIGFNTRIKIPAFSERLPKLQQHFTLSLAKLLHSPECLENYYPKQMAQYVIKGLMRLTKHFQSLQDDQSLMIHGPTIEGVGNYPVVNEALETNCQRIYITGDAAGLFRGLTAALLSGHYVGKKIASALSV